MTGFMSTLKSLPSAYNKDLQESVEPLLDCVNTVSLSLKIILGVLSTLSINRKHMQSALTVDMLATEVADYLVNKGVPFRQAHHIAGAVIKKAEESDVPIDKLSLEELRIICPEFNNDFSRTFDFENSVERRSSNGGTSKGSVLAQIEAIRTILPGLEEGALASVT
jgi:argininosuccinate lyase